MPLRLEPVDIADMYATGAPSALPQSWIGI